MVTAPYISPPQQVPPAPFRPVYLAGLLFCIAMPAVIHLIIGALLVLVDTLSPPALPPGYAPPAKPFSSPQAHLLLYAAPVMTCAFSWWLAHRRTHRIETGRFLVLATAVAAVAIIVVSPIYALGYNAEVHAILDRHGIILLIALFVPSAWPELARVASEVLGHAYAWLPVSLAPNAFGYAPGLWALSIYLTLVAGTVLCARLVGRSLRRRESEAHALTPPRSAVSPRG